MIHSSKTYTKPAETTYSLLYDSLCWISKDSGIAIEEQVKFVLTKASAQRVIQNMKLKKILLKMCQNSVPFQKLRKKLYGTLEKSPRKLARKPQAG